MTHELVPRNAYLEQLLYRARDPITDDEHFSDIVEEVGREIAHHMITRMETVPQNIMTCMGEEATHYLLARKPVLVPVLRAGDPLAYGMRKIFRGAPVSFIGAMRDEETLYADMDYHALTSLKDETVIIADTMIATGGSVIDTIKVVKLFEPKQILVGGLIAAEPGLQRIHEYDRAVRVYAAAIDPRLNEKGYIVPGLGDAGDRCFGRKMERRDVLRVIANARNAGIFVRA